MDTPAEKAYAKALHLLSYRDHSAQEIRRKLLDRGWEDHVVEETIVHLTERGYLNDTSYAARWARHLACNKLYGNQRIEAGLRQKGFDQEAIYKALEEARLEISEEEGMNQLLRKIEAAGKKNASQEQAAQMVQSDKRTAQYLMRKGYPAALIFSKIKKLKVDDGGWDT